MSIIVPVFNRPEFIPDCLNSLLSQSFNDWEALIVDDGSEQETVNIIEQFSRFDKRFVYKKRHGDLGGAPVCRNIGIQASRGNFLMFMDSDDMLAPWCLEKRVNRMHSKPERDFISFNTLLFGKIPGDMDLVWNVSVDGNDLNLFLRGESVWSIGGAFFSSAFLRSRELFWNESMPIFQDLDFYTRVLLEKPNYEKDFTMLPDYFYRIHTSDSISQGKNRFMEMLFYRERYYLGLNKQLSDCEHDYDLNYSLAPLVDIIRQHITYRRYRSAVRLLLRLPSFGINVMHSAIIALTLLLTSLVPVKFGRRKIEYMLFRKVSTVSDLSLELVLPSRTWKKITFSSFYGFFPGNILHSKD